MPCVRRRDPHRVKNSVPPLFNACVARPVGKAELAKNPKAREAMEAEWTRLREKGVWEEIDCREWDDVRTEADKLGLIVHAGYILGRVAKRNSELEPAKRKYKGRVASQGNRVVDQT